MPAGFRPVVPLEAGHDLEGFECGSPPLDHWLKNWARHSQKVGSAKTFVVCPEEDDMKVVGYHALAAATAGRDELPKDLRRLVRGGPDVVPMALLARLAVDQRYQGRKLGKALLRDALARVARAADEVGTVALTVHAKDDEACGFYRRFGFIPSPFHPLQLFLPMATIREAVRAAASEPGQPREADPRPRGRMS